LFGYDADLVASAAEQWARLPSLPSFLESEHRVRFAARLGQKLSKILGQQGRLAFELGGAQGIELAIRLAALANPDRRTVIVLEGAYHGRSITTSNLSSSYRYRDTLPALGFRIVRLPVPDLLHEAEGLGVTERLQACKAFATKVFTDESFGVATQRGQSDAMAFLFEPILNVAGMIDPGIEFVEHVLMLARDTGCVAIADEVFCGYHRTGPFVASSLYSVPPDMVVVAKATTNGMAPLSAVWASGDLASEARFPPGSYSTTFSNNPLHFMLGNAVLDKLEAAQDGAIARVEAFLRSAAKALESLAPELRHRTLIKGMTASIDLGSRQLVDAVQSLARQGVPTGSTGLLFASTAATGNRLMMHPPMTITDDEMELSLAAIDSLCRAF
jgi:4-aminobutyrate aminotransferase / (S)-3-amino-2-methylpropionate transaminase / 5-aminovalerate transaminase